MADRIEDRNGWPITAGARIRRYLKSGHRVKKLAIVTSVGQDPFGRERVEFEEMGSLNKGVCLSSQVEVMRSTGKTLGELRHKMDRVELGLASDASKRARRPRTT